MSSTAQYTESPIPASAAAVCEAVWRVAFSSATEDWLVLPDGCVDIVLVPDAPPLVAGPATGPSRFDFPAGTNAAGLRLLPGAGPALLGLPAEELADRLIPLTDLGGPRWPDELARAHEAVQAGSSASAAGWLLTALGRVKRTDRPDSMVRHAAELLRHDPGLATGELAARLSISERQLRRRFVAQVGYGPKRFARIMRLQRLLHLGRRHPEATLGWLAAAATYADQAHLAHDCHELAGRTPTALLAQRSTVVTRERAA